LWSAARKRRRAHARLPRRPGHRTQRRASTLTTGCMRSSNARPSGRTRRDRPPRAAGLRVVPRHLGGPRRSSRIAALAFSLFPKPHRLRSNGHETTAVPIPGVDDRAGRMRTGPCRACAGPGPPPPAPGPSRRSRRGGSASTPELADDESRSWAPLPWQNANVVFTSRHRSASGDCELRNRPAA